MALKPLVSVDQSGGTLISCFRRICFCAHKYAVGCLATVLANEEVGIGNRTHLTTPAILMRNNIIEPYSSRMTHHTRNQSEANPPLYQETGPTFMPHGNTHIIGSPTVSTSNPLQVVSARCGISHLQAMSAIYPSHSNMCHAILAGRKCWRRPKNTNEVVWPPHLEAALMEGLFQCSLRLQTPLMAASMHDRLPEVHAGG